ncbi:Orf y [Tanacetum coccineum]
MLPIFIFTNRIHPKLSTPLHDSIMGLHSLSTRLNRIHNHSIGQTISLVILKEKVKYSVEDMVSITTHSGLYHRHGQNPEQSNKSDNKAKLAFVENLLGESEKLMWQQWRTAYPNAYAALEAIADEPQNITSQIRQLILQLATKSGRLYFPSTTEKLFAKLPPSLSKKIEESFRAKHPGLSSGVLPAIKFTHTFVSEMCKDAALAKELRDLSLCSAIPIPGYYKNNRKKYGMRKSRTYKGKPHNSHVKPFKRKYKDDRGRVKKCKCFICGKEGHFAKNAGSKQETLQDQLFIKNWILMTIGILSHQQILMIGECLHKIRRMKMPFRSIDPLKLKRKKLGELIIEKKRHEEQKDEEKRELKAPIAEGREEEAEVHFSLKKHSHHLGNTHVAKPCVETEVHYFGNATTVPKIRKVTNQLYNVKVEFDIPNCKAFGTTCINDTGASSCSINKNHPKNALNH